MLGILKRVDRLDLLKGFHILIGHFDSFSGKHISVEFDLVLHPLTFVWRNAQPVVSQASQHLTGNIIQS